jgi:protein O-mannosyl-transferase
MPTKLLLPFLLITFSAFAQTEKGATPLPSTVHRPPSTVRAVVVGISDYQYNDITDLNFAAADAQVFADWLRSPAGGSVPEDNVMLLTNENATLGNFAMALDGLVDNCEEGDRAIIYFSGHGDVERKLISSPGFLLCHDAPAVCYTGGGAYSLAFLQEVVTTLSAQNKAQVIVVTDACHAGKLAGNQIGGAQLTAANLARQFANEVKIMSCQPNELSLESKQWGGGRGVFSYHLVRGLTGLANRDSDGEVTLFEIGRYLEDIVPAQVAPHKQLPQIAGEKQTVINRIDAPSLASLQHEKGDGILLFPTAMKGLEDDVLAKADSSERREYLAFRAALAAGKLLEPAGDCADFFHPRLVANEKFKLLAGLMTRNFVAALIDEVQQALNALLDNDPYEANAWIFNPAKYVEYPRYLRRSIELLGEKHYMYRSLLAKLHYFEGYNLARNLGDLDNDPLRRDSLLLAAKEKFLEAVQTDPEAAYPYHAIGALHYYHNPPQTDSLVWWCSQAADLSPSWLAPYLLISYEYGAALLQLEQAEQWLLLALERHPTSYLVLERLSWLKQWQGKADESIAISKEMIALKPDLFNAYSTLATTLTLMKGEYLESEQYCLASLAINPNQGWWAQTILLNNYLRTRRAAAAVEVGINCLNNNPTYSSNDKGTIVSVVLSSLVQLGRYDEATYWAEVATTGQWGNLPGKTHIAMELGRMYLRQGDLHRAEQTLLEALTIDVSSNESWPVIFALLGEIKAIENKRDEAEAYFTQGVANTGFMGHFFRDEAIFRYGRFLLAQKRPTEAEAQFREIAKILPKSYYHGYGMALLAAGRNNQTEALDWLEKSLENFWPDADSVLEEPLFKKLRKTKRFQALMKKHFPDQPKD